MPQYFIIRKARTRYIRTGQEWIVEVNLKERGVHIPALKQRFPKQKGQNADADEHHDHLKKYHGASLMMGSCTWGGARIRSKGHYVRKPFIALCGISHHA